MLSIAGSHQTWLHFDLAAMVRLVTCTKFADGLLLSRCQRLTYFTQICLDALHSHVGFFEIRNDMIGEDFIVMLFRRKLGPIVVEQ